MRKYKPNFIRDVKWYLSVRHLFDFDGRTNEYHDSRVVLDSSGVDGVRAFHILDSTGKIKPTKHPNILKALLKTKGSVNLHIKMYAEDRASGLLPKIEFDELLKVIDAPDWFKNAVESQKAKNYNKIFEKWT